MKRIITIFTLTVLIASCASTKHLAVEGTKPVPALHSYVVEMPLVKELGDVKLIHDFNNSSLLVFRGEEVKFIEKIKTWVDENLDPGEQDGKTPIVLIGGTDILPFISLKASEYQSLGEEDKKLFDQLVLYKRYTVTKVIFTYIEDMDVVQQQTYQIFSSSPTMKKSSGSGTNPNRKRIISGG